MTREITVTGGGLAGLALAVALCKRRVPVRVLEAGDYPRHRVCGEFISGVSSETLDYLGIRDLLEDARRHRSLCWHIGVEGGWINVCGLFRIDHSIGTKGRNLLASYLQAGGYNQLAHRLGRAEWQPEWRPGSFSAVAGFELGPQPVVDGLLCLGDAQSMIPPFTGNGMSMAFQAAETACGPLVSWVSGDRSWQAVMDTVRSRLRRRFRRRLAVAGVLHHFLTGTHGRSLLQSLSATGLLPFQPMLSLVR